MSLLRRGLIPGVSVLFVALCVSADKGSGAEMRTWTDAAGRKTDAKFVRVFNGEVILEKDGRMLKVPLGRFSAADQTYIREMTSAAAPPREAAAKTDTTSRGIGSASTAPSTKADDEKTAAAREPDAKTAAGDLKRMRDWRDSAGNVIKARFERLFGQQVVLAVGNRLRTVEFSRLSAADQEFLRKSFETLGRGAELPNTLAQTQDDRPVGTAADTALSGVVGNPSQDAATARPGFAAPPFSNFRDIANRMREHQEQIRATQDQLRSQVQQMHDEMRTARAGFGGRPRSSVPTPVSPPGADAAATSANNSTIASNTAPTVPDLSTPPGNNAPSGPATGPFATPAASRPGWAKPASPFERNRASPKVGMQPQERVALAPAMEPQYQEIIICGACNKAQKPGFKAGQRCQHCGRTIDEITDESGEVVERSSRSTRRNVKFWVWAVIVGISVIGGLIAKLKG